MHEVLAAVLSKEQIESIQRHQADPDSTPQIAGAAVQIIEAGRKVLLAGQPEPRTPMLLITFGDCSCKQHLIPCGITLRS